MKRLITPILIASAALLLTGCVKDEITTEDAEESIPVTPTVNDGASDGTGSWTYPSSGDPSSDDDISTTTFTRMVTVTYANAGATVSGYAASSTLSGTVSGNSVTINSTGDENIIYKLTGSAADGCFKLYSAKKMALVLSDLSLSSASGAAINIQSEKRCYVVVEGTNTLADGSSAAYSASGDEDMKAVFFSEGQLVFSGSGDLTVTANNKQAKSCIASDDYVRFLNAPSVTVSAGSSAGYVFAVTTSGSPEVALDANTEGGYKLYITGGVVVAYGGLENGYSASNTVYTLSGTAGAWNALYNGSSFIAAFKAPSGLSSFAVCAPSLSAGYKGVSVGGTTFCNGIWATSGISGGTAVSLSTYSGGQGGPGGGGPGGGGGGRW